MDQYQQRTWGIERWRYYSRDMGKNIPKSVTTGAQLEDLFKREFDQWLNSRRPAPDAGPDDMGSLPCKLKPGGKPGAKSDLYTDTKSCEIKTPAGQVLIGPVRDAFESTVNCKAETDAVIAHEEVHKRHCENAHRMDPAGGEAFMDSPLMSAFSEADAWTVHRERIRDAIHRIVNTKGCGWDPTARQRKDPDSIPSLKQVQDMSLRAWKAAAALSGGGVNPPDGGSGP
jgi:hypothetical protein